MAADILKPWEVMVFCVFTSIICWIAALVNKVVYLPYMDEIFHIPQAQKYCQGNFDHWDPKITTPPGLYLVSIPVSYVTQCSTDVLRAINIIFCLANVYVMYRIRRHIQPGSIISPIAIALLPVNFFFTFLYYTDPGCMFCLLMMYLFFLKRSHYIASIFGLGSLLFRQTSIVWVFFVACLTLAELLEKNLKKKESLPSKIRSFVGDSLINCIGYGFVGVAFLIFLHLNEGIVLGDKKAHEAVLHITQIGYMLVFSLLFGAPFIFSYSNFLQFIDFATRKPITILISSLVMYGLFENFIHVHPYILADNRHYTFYLWRRFLSKHWIRQILVPIYIYIGHSLYSNVRHMRNTWISLFVLCTCVIIVPQKLLEFRYFLFPYVLLRLHFREFQYQVVAEILAAVALNTLTLYFFLYGTFIWQHDPREVQRFMW